MKHLLVSLLLCIALVPVARADFSEGVTAYARGDYDTAAKVMISLAEGTDHPYAELWLGTMYAKGQGVKQDYEKAAKWLRSASEKGIAAAQYKLGIMYSLGQGVPQDMEFAYAWLSVSNKQGHKNAAPALAMVEGKLSGQEMEEAKKLAAEYIDKYGKPPQLEPEGIDKPININ